MHSVQHGVGAQKASHVAMAVQGRLCRLKVLMKFSACLTQNKISMHWENGATVGCGWGEPAGERFNAGVVYLLCLKWDEGLGLPWL